MPTSQERFDELSNELNARPRQDVAAPMPADNWADLTSYACTTCTTCRFFVPKAPDGRCRRHAPTMDGYPVVYPTDWCGDHRLGTNPSRPEQRRGPTIKEQIEGLN